MPTRRQVRATATVRITMTLHMGELYNTECIATVTDEAATAANAVVATLNSLSSENSPKGIRVEFFPAKVTHLHLALEETK